MAEAVEERKRRDPGFGEPHLALFGVTAVFPAEDLSLSLSETTTGFSEIDLREGRTAVMTGLKVGGFYSNSYEAPVLEVLTAPVAYHAIVLRRSLHGPCDAVRGVLPATGECRSCPTYLCQVGRTMVDPPILVSGRPQSRRVGHVIGLVVRGRRDVAAR
ncbi:hypothetical protein GW17_00043140 [Ensete ventricosum]|nr:hypothetical protein GW17_00043140 [Ensete ventricosum]